MPSTNALPVAEVAFARRSIKSRTRKRLLVLGAVVVSFVALAYIVVFAFASL